mmetsp:Transcript_18676/g.60091  ORF Transcript_18676/g.60091 Transcript_18676/m.60091 type:complete len:222 (+) Transcript_18676:1019-1684(+)
MPSSARASARAAAETAAGAAGTAAGTAAPIMASPAAAAAESCLRRHSRELLGSWPRRGWDRSTSRRWWRRSATRTAGSPSPPPPRTPPPSARGSSERDCRPSWCRSRRSSLRRRPRWSHPTRRDGLLRDTPSARSTPSSGGTLPPRRSCCCRCRRRRRRSLPAATPTGLWATSRRSARSRVGCRRRHSRAQTAVRSSRPKSELEWHVYIYWGINTNIRGKG